jgi:GT2 family glycosyltransferase
MLLKRRLLLEVGAFDTRYHMYGEDIDLCARAKHAGYRIVAIPRARTWHKVSASADKVSADTRYWRTRNRILFYRRFPHYRLAWLMPLFVVLRMATDLARDLIGEHTAHLGPLLRGIRDGLREPVEPP